MNPDKPFYLSKTLWANVLAFAATYIASATGASFGTEETAAIFVVVNFILRAVTKGAITLS